MAGIPGQGLGRTEKQAQTDAKALARIEKFLDDIANDACVCVECGKKLEIKEIPATAIKAAQIRYDKLRPSLASVTQDTLITHQNGAESDIVAQIRRLADANQDVKMLLLDILTAPAPVAESIQVAAQHGDNQASTQNLAS